MNTLVRQLATDNSLPALFNTFFGDEHVMGTPSNKPAVNIKETDDAFELSLAVPGLKKDDFKINLHNRNLTVSSEIKTETKETDENYSRREFSYQSFSRSFFMPKSANEEAIEATYEDGILKVTIAKKEEAKAKEPKMITVS